MLLTAAPLSIAEADCPASPGGNNDLLISFLAVNSTQVAPALLHGSTVKEGMLVYDDTDNVLKLCDGDDWVEVGAGGLAAHGPAGAVQFSDGSGGLLSDNANLHWDDADNRLGIGTAAPDYRLHVVGGQLGVTHASPVIYIKDSDNLASENALIAFVSFRDSAGTQVGWIGDGSGGANAMTVYSNTGTAHLLSAGGGVSVDTSGNVGIGTGAPGAKLHVYGAGNNGGSALFEAASWNSVRIKGVDGAGVQDSAFLKFEDAAGENTFIGLTGTTGANGGNVGDLRIGVSGERIRISKTTGNVGIGNVPLPRAKLHVAGGIKLADDTDACPGASNIKVGTLKYLSNTLSICNTGGWTALSTGGGGASSGTAGYVQISGGAGAFASSGTGTHQPLFWDSTNHRLGIGTTSPQSFLDLGAGSTGRSIVWGGSIGTGHYASIGTTYSSGDLAILSGLKLDAASDVIQYSFSGNFGALGMRFDYSTGDTIFFNEGAGAKTAGDVFNMAANTRMTIKADGNVGIGTTTPASKLRVSGGPAWTLNGWTKAIELDNVAAIKWSANSQGVRWGVGATNIGFSIFNNAADDTSAPSDYSFVISNVGNVGIGTPTPASKLQVVGGIQLANDAGACPGASNVKLGTLKYAANVLSVCNSSGWTALEAGSDAATLAGMSAATTATANTIAARDASADLYARYFLGTHVNISHAAATRNTDTVFYSSTDGYIRKNTAAGFRTSLDVYSKAEVNALAGSVTDGDKGDITVSGSGATWTIDAGAVNSSKILDGTIATADIANSQITYAKIQNVSATSRLLGRASAGAGVVEEITIGADFALSGTTLNLATLVDMTGHTFRLPGSTTLPATCAVGDLYVDTDATAGQRLFLCQATNTWAVQGDGSGITALTGDVTASGSGSVAATIAANAVTTAKIANSNVTNAKLTNMAANTVKGNNTGAAAAPLDLTMTQLRAILGSGTPGAGNFLRGDGTWVAPPTGADNLGDHTATTTLNMSNQDISGVKQVIGGFGAMATTGTLDWNDASNARSGSGYTLLMGNATNGPGTSSYFHPFSFEWNTKNGSGNLTQLAIPYGYGPSLDQGLFIRGRYSGTWSTWRKILTEDASGNVSASGQMAAASFSGSGAALTNLNASNLATGTVATARLGTGTANSSVFLRGDGTWAAAPGADNLGNHTATTTLNIGTNWINGDSGNEGISVSATGQVRIDHSGTGSTYDVWIQGGSATSGEARNLAILGREDTDVLYINHGGEYTGGTAIGGVISGNGSGLTTLNASQLTTGTVASARLGTGTANSSTFLRGDGTWQAVPAGTVTGTGAANHIAYWSTAGAIAHDANQLVWDAANNRLGVGISSPDTSLYVNGLIAGGFGAQSTSGTLDFNDTSNARPGQGQTMLRGSTAANAPNTSTAYWHPFSFEYSSKIGTGNLTQFAIPYTDVASRAAGMFMRFRHSETWSDWYRFVTADPNGNAGVTGNFLIGDGTVGTPSLAFASDTDTGMYRVAANQIGFATGGAQRLLLNASGATAAAFLYSSDRRLKENVQALTGDLAKLDALNPVTFSYISDSTHRERLGLMAQDVEEVYPQAVATGDDGMKSVDYPSLVPALVSAVKALKADNENLRNLLNAANDNQSTVIKELRAEVETLKRLTSGAH